jgi:tetratricopeptide (TPR) repeat protein
VLLVCALLIVGHAASAWGQTAGRSPTPAGHVDGRDALQRAAVLVQQGRLDEAEQHARAALSDPGIAAVAYSVLGTIRFQQERLAESVTFLQKALALEPGLPGAQRSLAALKQSPEGLFVLAADFIRTGNRPAAAALTTEWMRLDEVPHEWSAKFGSLLAKEGIVHEAVAVLERASRSGARSYELAFNLAGAYLLNKEPARALEQYDVALGLERDSIPALRQAGAIAEQEGELERSLSYWLRARKLEPANPEILLGFGRVCLRMDLLEDAEPALTQAATLRPDDPAYQYTLAAAKVGKRQFEAAQRLIEQLVQKRPDDAQLQYALGSILYIQGHLPEAAARLRESVRLHPEQLASHYYLALVARDLGKDAEAIEMFERLLRRHPDHAASSEALGGLLMAARRYPEAEANLRHAIRLNPKSVKANYQLGLLLARMGRKEEADKQLELAKSLRQEDEAASRLQLRLLDPGQ